MVRSSRSFLSFVAVAFCLVFSLAAEAATKPKPSGTVTISAKQIAFLVSGQRGGGTMRFKGKSYPFKIGGLGVGGIGISKLTANGEVFYLENAADFYGAYASARVGWAVGDASGGQMWLKNEHGVVLHLWTARKGLALTLGADVVDISRP
jgi:hypothetical protein